MRSDHKFHTTVRSISIVILHRLQILIHIGTETGCLPDNPHIELCAGPEQPAQPFGKFADLVNQDLHKLLGACRMQLPAIFREVLSSAYKLIQSLHKSSKHILKTQERDAMHNTKKELPATYGLTDHL